MTRMLSASTTNSPATPSHIEPFALADSPVTCGEWLAFMEDDGYSRPDLWLSDGWATAQAEQWDAPLYWFKVVDDWWLLHLGGPQLVDPAEPVCHISYYEADAFARWAGGRLPTEVGVGGRGRGPGPGRELPRPVGPASATRGRGTSLFGNVWQWTSSSYSPYPGFRPAPGAVGEYNGKFMVNQYVLRGGSCVTSSDHIRATYRNFFPPRHAGPSPACAWRATLRR